MANDQAAAILCLEGVWGPEFERLAEDFQIARDDGATLPSEGEWLADVRAVVVRNKTQVDEGFLVRLPSLEVVARAGVGLDNIDLDAARARGVVVVAALGANAQSVAEHTVGLALAVARSMMTHDRATRDGGWDRFPGVEISGKTWGLLGAGATGRATAVIARALGARVLAYDPYADEARCAELGIELRPLDDVVSHSQIVSCHLPAVAATAQLVNADLLARMPQGSILVNTGRGEAIDEDALGDALESGHLLGAGIDVRAQEPPSVGRLEQLDNVVLSPHVAGITRESQARIREILADDIRRVLSGLEAQHRVGAGAA